jgi:hypothetical protein
MAEPDGVVFPFGPAAHDPAADGPTPRAFAAGRRCPAGFPMTASGRVAAAEVELRDGALPLALPRSARGAPEPQQRDLRPPTEAHRQAGRAEAR